MADPFGGSMTGFAAQSLLGGGSSTNPNTAWVDLNSKEDPAVQIAKQRGTYIPPRAAFSTRMDEVTRMREADLAAGRARGQELFGDKSMGRLEETRGGEIAGLLSRQQSELESQNRSLADLVSRRQANLQGFSPEEMNAMREQNLSSANQSFAGQMRSLRSQQAASGVRGALAAAQRAKMLGENQGQNVSLERDLFLQNIAQRRAALDALEGTTGAQIASQRQGLAGLQSATERARADELGRQQFNIAQTAKERYGQLASELGWGSLGAGERSAILQQMVGEEQADAAVKAATPKGGTWLCTEADKFGGLTEHQRKLLKRFRRAALILDRDATRLYLKRGDELIRRMIKQGADWAQNHSFVMKTIALVDQCRYVEAYKEYKKYCLELMDKHWPECDDEAYWNLKKGGVVSC